MEEVDRRLAKALSLLLDRNITENDDVRMDSCDTWTSMKHIEIILVLEESFQVSFAPQDIPRLTSQSLLANKLKELSRA